MAGRPGVPPAVLGPLRRTKSAAAGASTTSCAMMSPKAIIAKRRERDRVMQPGAPGSRQLSRLLRRYRMRADLTQEQLAERAGVSTRGVQDLERGLYSPRASTVDLLVEALDLTGD